MSSSSGRPTTQSIDNLHEKILSQVKYIDINNSERCKSLKDNCNALITQINLHGRPDDTNSEALKICAANTVQFIQAMDKANHHWQALRKIVKINSATFPDYMLLVSNAKLHYQMCVKLTSSLIFFWPVLMHDIKEHYLNQIIELEILKSELYKKLYEQAKSFSSPERMVLALEHMQDAHLSISDCIKESSEKQLSISKQSIDDMIDAVNAELRNIEYDYPKKPIDRDVTSPRLFSAIPPAAAATPAVVMDDSIDILVKEFKLLSPKAQEFVPGRKAK